ncbi:MAG: peptide MFS transporter, partial [Rhodothermales bacterium]
KTFFGHPRGLATLFFTEMWERFSYYGMRALLVLFMVATVEQGGFGMSDEVATAIYGLYTAAVYLFALPGGWAADRLFGARKAVLYGGILIAAGHFSMAFPSKPTFFLGLILIVLGTGLLKPNVSAVVGDLYPEGGARRDAGFSIFYMGINLGAFIGPLICGFLGENVDWHLGFAAAGFFMVIGVIQFKLTEGYLGTIGLAPGHGTSDPVIEREKRRTRMLLGVGTAIFGLIVLLALTGILEIDALAVAKSAAYVILGLALVFFIYVFAFGHLTPVEKKRTAAIAVFFVFSMFFWSGFEQAGSSLNLFAERFTDRGLFGWEMPASWLQSINPIFIIILAPVFGQMWIWLSSRRKEPSSPAKFAIGLVSLGLGFFVMVGAANVAAAGDMAMPTWLIFTYLLHTTGELALSPVGLSLTTKLAPKRFASQMMGVWFMSISLGNLVAGLIAGVLSAGGGEDVEALPDLFMTVTLVTVGAGLVLALLIKPIRKLMPGVH